MLECVAAFFAKEATHSELIFITNDALLRDAANDRLSGNSRFRLFEDSEAYFGDLRLTQENQTRKFDTAMQRTARVLFESLVKEAFQRAEVKFKPDSIIHKSEYNGRTLTAESSGSWSASSRATFVERRGERWIWSSKIQYGRDLREEEQNPSRLEPNPFAGSATLASKKGEILASNAYVINVLAVGDGSASRWRYTVSYDVSWSCAADEDGTVSDGKIEDVTLDDETLNHVVNPAYLNYPLARSWYK